VKGIGAAASIEIDLCRITLALTGSSRARRSCLVVISVVIPHPSIYNCEGTVNPTDLSDLAFPGTVNCAFLLQKLTGGWRGSRLPPPLVGYPLPDSGP
jgi:hypothetical protein